MSLQDSSNPFVGLRPFESNESLLFFGRQEQTLELLQRLHVHHFVAVVGSSGSGKSSLIRAGLIPSLKAGYLVDNRDKWAITVMKPGESPLYNLADAILSQLTPETNTATAKNLLKKIKEEGFDAVLNVIQSLWKEKNTNFFLLVDQFEELFRFSIEQNEVTKRDDAIDFVNIMLELSQQTALPVYVVMTMRSDFIGDCSQFYGLPEAMNQSQYLVPRLNRVQLKTAIEGPVKLYGGSINSALISKLLNDIGAVKDELPLLQHALMRIWDHETNVDKSGELDMSDYEFIGGIEKALSRHADEVLEKMAENEANLAKKIFQALTRIDDNGRKVRRPARLKELKEITNAKSKNLLAVINQFIEDKRSFLVINKITGDTDAVTDKTNEQPDVLTEKTELEYDAVIDISHESLIRQWNTLSEWVDDEAKSAKIYLRLIDSAKYFSEYNRDLMSAKELESAFQWQEDFQPTAGWAKRYNQHDQEFKESIIYLTQKKDTNERSYSGISVDDFINDREVLGCLDRLEKRFGKSGENLIVSDVLDREGHQYVNLVQKGGGVLGVALVGYTYILEQMNIRFIRLAGTSAGAINTALMTVIGGKTETIYMEGERKRVVTGDKKKAKSKEILKIISNLNFFDLVDGHPAARWIIKEFIKQKDFNGTANKLISRILITLIALPFLDFIFLGLQHQFVAVSILTKISFVLTGFFFIFVAILVFYLGFLFTRLKDSGFGINPGDYFYDWIKLLLAENNVHSVSDLISKASTPVRGLYLRVPNDEGISGLEGDVTFIASELVTENKIEFPKMWKLFRTEVDMLQPAGFVRASMSIPIFFQSYYIDFIPCTTESIKEEWARLGEPDPPSVARFVDGGILSNFPIDLFYNPNVEIPRLPSFGIDVDDTKAPVKKFGSTAKQKDIGEGNEQSASENTINYAGKHPENWSLPGFIYRLFSTMRSYYDKDFLIKNAFFKKGIGVIPLKGFGWLNFFLDNNAKREMFILGAKAATKFLEEFDWEEYKSARLKMQKSLKERSGTGVTPGK